MGTPSRFIGLTNYVRAFGDYRVADSAGVTLFFVTTALFNTIVAKIKEINNSL